MKGYESKIWKDPILFCCIVLYTGRTEHIREEILNSSENLK